MLLRRKFIGLTLTMSLAGCSLPGYRRDISDTATAYPSPHASPGPTLSSTPTPGNYLQGFRKGLDDRDVIVTDLAEKNDVVVLEHSVESQTRRSFNDAVKSVILAFMETPGRASWRIDRVEVAVVVDGQMIASYHIESIWFRQLSNDQINSDLFLRKVADTMEMDSGLPASRPNGTSAETKTTHASDSPSTLVD